ncbi:VOC family protein [Hyphomonas sp.]|uniref:VOC family protein n=1 Tax=Hyphomonas sp. TaxID=87 RepID=UPI00391CE05D
MALKDAGAVTFILTADRAAAKPFYETVLGLRLLSDDAFAAVFDLGGGAVLRLTDIEGHTPGPHTVLGWNVPDIEAAMASLAARGVKFIEYPGMTDAKGLWVSPGGKAKVCWFNDPDGNNLSLTAS